MIELLETIEPKREVVEACKKLKEAGYTLALDDFVYKPGYEEFVELADIIKVDFLQSTEEERNYILKRLAGGKTKLLAEKIETIEDYKKAYEQGYSYFQGYFFCKPMNVSTDIIPPNKTNYLQLLKEVNSGNINFQKISKIIERDVAFSYEMLRLVNSVAYYPAQEIKSIRQAIVYLGQEELKKWVYISVLRKVVDFKDSEVVDISMIRAKTLEQICETLGLRRRKSEFVTLGMLSMIDVLMGISIEVILDQIAISDEIRNILLNKNDKNVMSRCYSLVLAYEKADWAKVLQLCKELKVEVKDITQMYYNSVLWIQKLKKVI